MKSLDLKEYSPVINSIEKADEILKNIDAILEKEIVEIDFEGIRFLSTNCSKHIFGHLFLELGQEAFFDKVIIKNASNNVRVSINAGSESSITDASDY